MILFDVHTKIVVEVFIMLLAALGTGPLFQTPLIGMRTTPDLCEEILD